MATYFITGATGTIGREVIQALSKEGHRVLAASRHPEKSQELFGNQVEHVLFDFTQPNTFPNLSSLEGIFLLGPPLNMGLFDLLTPFTDALIAQGSVRLVYLSAYGMEYLPEIPFHTQMEEKLASSQLDWRILRPGFFMQNFGNYERENIEQRKILFSPAGEGRTPFISATDIGKAVAVLLEQDNYRHQIFELTGDQAFSYVEVADMLSDILGETITYTNPDEATYRAVLAEAGAPPFIADYMISIYGLIKNGKVAQKTDHVERLLGRKPQSLREVLVRDFD